MAKIGFEYVAVGKLNESASKTGATAVYTDSMYIGESAAFTGSPTANDVKDYGDDRVVETDTSVTGGTITCEKNELTLEQYAYMLGHTLDATKKEVLSNTDDIAPFLGVGLVGKSKRSNAGVYTGKFYYKCQFKEPSDENTTKQESTTFSHTSLEGNLFQLENGDWKIQKEFSTLAEAKTWVNGLLSIEEG